jgi:integrase
VFRSPSSNPPSHVRDNSLSAKRSPRYGAPASRRPGTGTAPRCPPGSPGAPRRNAGPPPSVPPDAKRRREHVDETKAVAKTSIQRLLSRRDVPLRERALWRMLYETAAHACEILSLNVEDLDLENRCAPLRSKGGDTQRSPGGEAVAEITSILGSPPRTH